VLDTEQTSCSLADALEHLDQIVRSGEPYSHELAREIVARCAATEATYLKFRELAEGWPDETKGFQLQGVLLSVARRKGDKRDYLQLKMEMSEPAPHADLLPLQAWTVLNIWFSEAGHKRKVDLPLWVTEYLARTAFEVQRLRANRKLSANSKVKELPAALEFIGNGRNPFAADEKAMQYELAAIIYEKEDGKLSGEARIEPIRQLFNLADVRTARRYVAKGKRYLSPLPKWLK